MNKQKLSMFFCFVLMLFSSTFTKADDFNQNPENVSKTSTIGLYSKKTSDVIQKDDGIGLYSNGVRFRAVGGGGGPIEGFVDPGGKDDENAYVDPSPSPLGSFPCVFLLCLAIGYGIYKKKLNKSAG
jgi:hypothetical protein